MRITMWCVLPVLSVWVSMRRLWWKIVRDTRKSYQSYIACDCTRMVCDLKKTASNGEKETAHRRMQYMNWYCEYWHWNWTPNTHKHTENRERKMQWAKVRKNQWTHVNRYCPLIDRDECFSLRYSWQNALNQIIPVKRRDMRRKLQNEIFTEQKINNFDELMSIERYSMNKSTLKQH